MAACAHVRSRSHPLCARSCSAQGGDFAPAQPRLVDPRLPRAGQAAYPARVVRPAARRRASQSSTATSSRPTASTSPATSSIRRCAPTSRRGASAALLIANLLEHVRDRAAVAAACEEIVGPGGLILATVPSSFPYHADPIDTGYRPSPGELAAAFPGSAPLLAEEVTGRTYGRISRRAARPSGGSSAGRSASA